MWYIKYKNGDILHFNPNHDPRNGRFSEGKGGRSKPSFKRWINSTEEDGLDRYKKNNKVTGPVSGTKRGVVETLRAGKKGYQKLKKVSNKIVDDVLEGKTDKSIEAASNKENIKFGEHNQFTIPKNVIDKVDMAFNKGPNSAVVKTVLDDQKKGFFDPNITETDIKKALRNKPDEITLHSYIRSDNGKKGISGVATYYGYNKDGSENADHKKVFGDHLVEVEFDAQTGKVYFVSLQG